MGLQGWEQQSIVAGRPVAGAELTEDCNPLEAALCHAVSLSKGCYMGQETLAKVAGKQAVKQQLWGLQTSQLLPVGAEVWTGKSITMVEQLAFISRYDRAVSLSPYITLSGHQEALACMGSGHAAAQ